MRFCRKCGLALNEQTGLCSKCDNVTGSPPTGRKLPTVAIISAVAVITIVAAVLFFLLPKKDSNSPSPIIVKISGIEYDAYPLVNVTFTANDMKGVPVTELGRQYVSMQFNGQQAQLAELAQLNETEFSARAQSPISGATTQDIVLSINSPEFGGEAFASFTPEQPPTPQEQESPVTEPPEAPAINKGEYIFAHSAEANLTDSELENMSLEKLRLARNEIFARHGYNFSNETYKQYFSGKSWYTPNSTYSGDLSTLNKFETYNVNLIKSHEERWTVAAETPTSSAYNYYIFPQSASAYLDSWDLNYLPIETLQLARNEIYARHGYIFSKEQYKNYFNNQAWYTPNSNYDGGDSSLNKYELYNVNLIKEYEDGGTVSSTPAPSNSYSYSEGYIFSISGYAYLTDFDLRGLSLETLQLARNEIFARHGYIFSNEKYSQYFNAQSWYTPNSSFNGDTSSFNKYEKYNIDLIKSHEEALQ